VPQITSGKKGETITVLACCNAEGTFIPPFCIFKGKNKTSEFEDNVLPGSVMHMRGNSAFFIWLKDHFFPRKPAGKVLLIFDGHASHSLLKQSILLRKIILSCFVSRVI
jgi:hypothetical protein